MLNKASYRRAGDILEIVKSPKWAQNLAAILVILLFAWINVSSVRREYALTTDEDKHYLYGERIVSGDSSRFNPSTMPITALNAIPKKVASFLDEGRIRNILDRHSTARMVTVLFSCLIAFLVFHWARSLYGFVPAIFSLALYVLDPNIIAHSQLVTTDIYLTGFMVLSFHALWKFAHNRSLGNGLLSLFFLGITQLTKYNAIVLFPLFLATLVLFDMLSHDRSVSFTRRYQSHLMSYVKYTFYAAIATILIINLGFLFDQTFKKVGEYKFHSSFLNDIRSNIPVLSNIPVPVPEPYLGGLDFMSFTEQTGSAPGNVYLLGRVKTGEGFPGYYFVATLFKVPISTQIILMLSLGAYFLRKDPRKKFFKNEIFLLIPVFFFAVYFNFLFKTQVGIRYYLPVFPFLYIFAGSLFVEWDRFSRVKKGLSVALLVYLFVSVISYYPYHLSYFNEIVWNRIDAYKYLADSNVDWGQDKNELQGYLEEHPNALYKPSNVRPGHLVVRINDLVGVTQDPEKYAWLRNNFEPEKSIGYSYLVYIISQEEIDELCSTTAYCDK